MSLGGYLVYWVSCVHTLYGNSSFSPNVALVSTTTTPSNGPEAPPWYCKRATSFSASLGRVMGEKWMI